MPSPKVLKLGDPCPSCGRDELTAAGVPTDDQRRLAEDKDVRLVLPYGFDNATAQQRQDLGALYVCDHCGYKTRFPLEESPDETAAAGNSKGRGRAAKSGD